MFSKVQLILNEKCCYKPEELRSKLQNEQHIKSVEIASDNNIVVETNLPSSVLVDKIESLGCQAIVRGFSGSNGVAIIDCSKESIQGVVRLIQVESGGIILDGVLDGLPQSENISLSIHEFGDLSKGCESVGCTYADKKGELGTLTSNENGRVDFRLKNENLDLGELIGRSLVVCDQKRTLACGIIARSAGLFENMKTICACDGTTLWSANKT